MEKRAEKVGILLQKKGINQAPIMRVGDALDISGSMSRIISSGALQQSFDQTMGVAVKFDDNGELDVFKF
ncbi:MAG: Tellurium resistance protein, partial [Stutzerimonas stutzeri]